MVVTSVCESCDILLHRDDIKCVGTTRLETVQPTNALEIFTRLYTTSFHVKFNAHLRISLDINECSLSTDNCDPTAYCINIEGSYLCACDSGYVMNQKVCQGDNSTIPKKYNIHDNSLSK